MKKSNLFKKWTNVYLLSVILILVLIVIWALTEKEPKQEGQLIYGSIFNFKDYGAAIFFGAEKPGLYVVNKNNKPVTAVRGGLGMIFRGDIEVGMKGFSRGLFQTSSGIILFIILVTIMIGWIPLKIFRKTTS